MDSTTISQGHDAPDSRQVLDINRAGSLQKTSQVVKAEAQSVMGSPGSGNQPQDRSSPISHFHGDVTPTKNSTSTTSLSSRVERIRDSLEGSISDDARKRIDTILDDVKQLSDVEKLLLYLRLPTGTRTKDIPPQTPSSLHLSNLEHAQAFTWIQSHLEEDNETCLRKDEVFDDYRNYCESNNMKPLNTADFGKVMKRAFPNVKPRRLGQRGQSKLQNNYLTNTVENMKIGGVDLLAINRGYCYSGLRKRLEVQPPSLPDLGECFEKEAERQKTEDEELMPECIALVCEWADNLLGKSFSSVRELSEHLLTNLYVNSKSTAAFALTAAMQKTKKKDSKVPVSSLFATKSNTSGKGDTQIQIQRRIQEREMLREQKKKLQKQREEHGGKEEKRKGVKKLFSPPQAKSEFPEQQTSCALQGMPMEPWYHPIGGHPIMGRPGDSPGSAFSRPMIGPGPMMPGSMPHHGVPHGPLMAHGPMHGPVPGSMQPSTLEEILDQSLPKSSHEMLPSTIASGHPELAQAVIQQPKFTPIKLQPKTVSSMLKEQRGFASEGDFYDGRSVASLLKETREKEFNSNMKRTRDDSDQGSASKRQHLDFQESDNIIDYLNSSGEEQMLRGMARPPSNQSAGFVQNRPPSNSQYGRPPRPPSNSGYGNRPPSNSGYSNRPPSNSGLFGPPRHAGPMCMKPRPPPPYHHNPVSSAPEYHTFQQQQIQRMASQGVVSSQPQRFDKPAQSPGVLRRQRGSGSSPPQSPCTSSALYRGFPAEPHFSQAKPPIHPMSCAEAMPPQQPALRGMVSMVPNSMGFNMGMMRLPNVPQDMTMGQLPSTPTGQPPFQWPVRQLGPQHPPPGPPRPPHANPQGPTGSTKPSDPTNVSDDLQSTLDVLRDFDTQYFNNQSSDLEDSNNSLTKLLHQNQNELSAMTTLQESTYSHRQSEANQVVPPEGILAPDTESILTYENLTGPKLGNPPITH